VSNIMLSPVPWSYRLESSWICE